MFDIFIDSISDPNTRDVIRKLVEELGRTPLSRFQGRFAEVEVTSATTKSWPHSLGFRPKDIVEIGRSGSGTVTWNFDSFTNETISFTTTGAVTVRFLVGTYKE